jgi:hypothetical protein
MSKKWDFDSWVADQKEAESAKQNEKTPEEIAKYTIDESVRLVIS